MSPAGRRGHGAAWEDRNSGNQNDRGHRLRAGQPGQRRERARAARHARGRDGGSARDRGCRAPSSCPATAPSTTPWPISRRGGSSSRLRAALDEGRPFLGICLGYQLLFTESEEFGQGKGLDVIPGVVRRFPPGLKVPHMGWNRWSTRAISPSSTGCPAGRTSTSCTPTIQTITDASLAVATCTYGVTVPGGGGPGSLFATQFHPEKSQRWGVRILENFAAFVRDGRT